LALFLFSEIPNFSFQIAMFAEVSLCRYVIFGEHVVLKLDYEIFLFLFDEIELDAIHCFQELFNFYYD